MLREVKTLAFASEQITQLHQKEKRKEKKEMEATLITVFGIEWQGCRNTYAGRRNPLICPTAEIRKPWNDVVHPRADTS